LTNYNSLSLLLNLPYQPVEFSRKRSEILKTSEKNILYWEAFQYNDLNELLKVISKIEVRSRIELGIDRFNDYLVRNFKLDY
jgi:hypothetical protein